MPKRKSGHNVVTPTHKVARGQKQKTSAAPTPSAHSSASATRSSKRLKTSENCPAGKSTPTKSKYFEQSESEDEEEVSEADDDASGYDDDAESDLQNSSVSSSEEEYDSEDEKPSKRKKAGRQYKQNGTTPSVVNKSDLWREGVKTGLGPGKQVFIERPKARGDGGIKYVPDRIHPNTLEFLKDLKKNNDRIWLKAHDADYRTSWKDFESFVETLSEKISEIDDTVPELPPKDVVFRIYRDIRFSSDPTPYKPHFSAAFSRTGRKGPYACYYIQIQPGRCFVGSGLWHPEAAPLALLRTDIDQRPESIRGILTDPNMRKEIFGGIGKDAKKACMEFCKQNSENALKTKPKGYDADHHSIELMRLRNFTIGQKVSDEEILKPNGIDRIIELVGIMKPFVTYLNSVVMPDNADDENNTDTDTDTGADSSNSESES